MTEQMTDRVDFDPGPVPPPTERDRLIAQRVRAIAAMHAAATWFTEHPDAPLPYKVTLNADAAPDYLTPEPERIARLEQFAEKHDASRHAIKHHEYADVQLAETRSHGIEVVYTVWTSRKFEQ